jgi:hypothetical protein
VGWGAPPAPTPPPAATPAPAATGGDPRVAELEAHCAQLRRDVDHIALFARTLLALLEEKQVATEQQFQDALRKLESVQGPPAS